MHYARSMGRTASPNPHDADLIIPALTATDTRWLDPKATRETIFQLLERSGIEGLRIERDTR